MFGANNKSLCNMILKSSSINLINKPHNSYQTLIKVYLCRELTNLKLNKYGELTWWAINTMYAISSSP